ncbi:hypothetical protein EJB05_01415 [Eragrostis curvula]|uniref:Uncharacterized protein n=1 Tax=Eragrostis curvula TaxID=38414 RepID=A0A5J9WRU4_9POAL|nr:hypothetical protein EJB05_01415 [Eragrostis curvula]
MGQCSFSRQLDVEKVRPQPAAAACVVRRQEQLRKRKAAAHMKQPYHAKSHEDLVLMVSLDAITKIG